MKGEVGERNAYLPLQAARVEAGFAGGGIFGSAEDVKCRELRGLRAAGRERSGRVGK